MDGQTELAPLLYVYYLMSSLEQVSKMRALAAELRLHATETSLQTFRRKFESAASELEQRAVDAEGRAGLRLAN
jgi:hypothetical protein